MLSANEIRNVRFSTAMGGYKKEEVDVLLDKVVDKFAAISTTAVGSTIGTEKSR